MAEIKLTRRVKYAGDIVDELVNKAGWDLETAILFANNLPDVKDRAEVVRCKDCRWSRTNPKDDADVYYCELRTGRAYHSGDFCSYGERRSDGR